MVIFQVFKDLYTFKGNEKTTLSKEGFITVQADASAIAGTYNITVEKVAERHQITTRPVDLSDPDNLKNKIDLEAKIEKMLRLELMVKKSRYLRI